MIASFLLAWLGCVAAPRVVPIDFVLAEPETDRWSELGPRAVEGLRHDLDRRRLIEVVGQGRTLSSRDLEELPTEVAAAAYALSARPVPRQHMDLRLLVDGPDSANVRPLTLDVHERVLSLVWGELGPSPGPDRPATKADRDAVARRFGLGGLRNGSAAWSHDEVAIVERALTAVEPEVVALLGGMPIVRQGTSTRAPGRELAWFDPRTEPPNIEVYDLAFAPCSGAIGPHTELEPLAVMTLVHELAHVLADAPLRRAWLGTAGAPLTRQGRRDLRHGGPVVSAWRKVRDHRAPTPYGRRDAHESFAEAYALHRLDPAALADVMPEGSAWFSEGKHLMAAGLDVGLKR